NLGIASRYLGETQQAMAYYRQALAAWPDQKAAKGNLETLLEAMEPARPDGAAEPVSETAADQ
ncbi:MAG: hypothetical protein JXO50_12425, partial [Deltaproteobacteria bacterium]|nr:hypothetical protein [Candidatus Anaeroferrophillus wilburensis]